MCGQDRPQRPQSSFSSKEVEAGLDLCRPPLNTSATSSSMSSTSSSTSQVSSSSSSSCKKRKWYKPKLKLNLHKDWIWVGFIRAGPTTPTGQRRNQAVKENVDDWEQLPAYAPRGERTRWERMDGVGGTRRVEQNDWTVNPPSGEPGTGSRDKKDVDPPEYR